LLRFGNLEASNGFAFLWPRVVLSVSRSIKKQIIYFEMLAVQNGHIGVFKKSSSLILGLMG